MLHVGERESGQLGDLGSGQVGAVAQRKNLALPIGESSQRLSELGLEAELGRGAEDGRQLVFGDVCERYV